MRCQRGTRSRNIDDRRARRSPGRRRVGGGLSLGGVLAILAISWFLGINPMTFLGGNVGSGSVGLGGGGLGGGDLASDELRTTPEEEELVDFISFVLDDLQATWRELLPGYRDATLVLFRDATRSGCGVGQSEMGPFYCGADEQVYIDLSFYAELRSQFGAPGDFAQAYVLAHEIGHHVQTLTGISDNVRQRQEADPASRNDLSVRQELQADCFAGVWGYSTAQRGNLDPDDVEEGLRAAAAIGDDRIQRMGGRGVHPESFTHGSSAQRVEWLRRGLESGDPDSRDTF
jgi:predicted metalloprotease